MHLENLKLTRFRSAADTNISFQPDLTVLVGENNGGKSNIIDAIRLLTLPLSGRRDRYAEEDDLRRESNESFFEIEGRYAGLGDVLKGLLISAVPDPTKDDAIFGLRHHIRSADYPRGRTSHWAGRFDTNEPERGANDVIRHVYLPPLRNAQQELGSGSATRITALLKNFLETEEEEQAFVDSVKRNEKPHPAITSVNDEIGSALGELTGGVRRQSASLDFDSEALFDVARDLRFKLADEGLKAEDIRLSGLGYANLLYMAAVVVELAKAREADLTLFLVEEPEAHLHPQLQMLVLDFLLDQARRSTLREAEPGQPEGRIQVIVTTHSPNLTAWVSPKHLVVVRSRELPAEGTGGAVPPPKTTVALSIADLNLKPAAINKISRYLDVTRSALLFGNRAILVEGIAEALLLPVFAERVVLKDDREAFRRFRGAVVVAIDGVDFKPYVEVLLQPLNGARIADRLVVVTDADPAVPGNRKENLEELAAGFGAAANLEVFINERTLEHELFRAGNEKLLKLVFLSVRPRLLSDWKEQIEAAPPDQKADAFLALLKAKNIRKGDLAQQIAQRVGKGAKIQVPDYLANAIRSIARS